MQKLIFMSFVFLFVFCSREKTSTNIFVVHKQKNTGIKDKQKPKKISEIILPSGYEREKIDSNSFAFFLRNFPLKKDNTVYYFNGKKKYNQSIHFAVLDIDVGTRDLQQCADAVMRLRAEYLFKTKQYSKIHFNFLSDKKPRFYTDYAHNNRSYKTFRKYMNYIFSYANTSSLHDEIKKVKIEDMQIGDVFIQKGNPYGHAIIIVDMAEKKATGEKIFLIAQSFMPAQSIHILKNFNNKNINPWYPLNFGQNLYTPEWTFSKEDLRRF